MIVFSIVLFLFLVPTYVITPTNVQILVLSPDFWPYIVAGLLGIGGILLLIQHAIVKATGGGDEEHEIVRGGALRVAMMGGLMVVYFVIVEYIGMVYGSMIAYMLFMAIIGFPRKRASALVAVALPLLLYAFFAFAAGVPIPQAEFLRLPSGF